ncbi:MAG: hypothetical protein ACRBN8_40875 [Nannocystales bacterium]
MLVHRVMAGAAVVAALSCRTANPAFDDDDTDAFPGSTEQGTDSSVSVDPTSVSTSSTSQMTLEPPGSTTRASSSDTTTTSTAGGGSLGSSGTTELGCEVTPPPSTECDPACDMCEEGTCVVVCNAMRPCQDQQLMCPGPGPCLFECRGADSCTGAVFMCQGEDSCGVACLGLRACLQAEVKCAGGPCSVTCGAAGSTRVCEEMLVQCGEADTLVECQVAQTVPPELIPGSACACESMGC